MKRFDDHDLRLIAFARQEIGKPFAWGETNCVSLALRAIDVQCGTDLAGQNCKRMSTERRAMAWVARNGLSGLVQRLRDEGVIEIALSFIQTGDIALVEMAGNIGASVYLGRNYLSSSSDLGVIQLRPASISAPSIVMGVR
jgi:hypothetical protein